MHAFKIIAQQLMVRKRDSVGVLVASTMNPMDLVVVLTLYSICRICQFETRDPVCIHSRLRQELFRLDTIALRV
ncbi:uncharacterized protein BO96DRAFT_213174 [Aspergillus niger CBS 101883]|uniref:uncharacterized protein n=1 Tax=Aspergillus lacticoffeatus (strain CBS 101883) TaxID=1450533 RepID=UPI000D7F293D|nr:uncharacterized protein BO96DRAFT_213174 [Aspergillus niger CBS 101883]PYH59547.1 hypothetical protein BO96DRAFT_213174 [Aspergillus niger CBS 101883]